MEWLTHFDVSTSILFYCATMIVLIISLLIAIKTYNKDYLKVLTLGMAVETLGYLLIINQPSLDVFLGVIISNFLLVLGYFIEIMGS